MFDVSGTDFIFFDRPDPLKEAQYAPRSSAHTIERNDHHTPFVTRSSSSFTCSITSTSLIGACSCALFAVNFFAIFASSSSFLAPVNLSLLSFILVTVIYQDSQVSKKTSFNWSLLLKAALLASSLVINALYLRNVLDLTQIPGQLAGLQLGMLGVGGLLIYATSRNDPVGM